VGDLPLRAPAYTPCVLPSVALSERSALRGHLCHSYGWRNEAVQALSRHKTALCDHACGSTLFLQLVRVHNRTEGHAVHAAGC
jgi:hypothetical protein